MELHIRSVKTPQYMQMEIRTCRQYGMEVTKIVSPSVYHMFSLYLIYLLFWFIELRPLFGFVDMILVVVLPVPGNCLLLL